VRQGRNRDVANYTFAQLQELWKQAGGNPAAAAIAAAVALAESAGNPNAVNTNGGRSTDRGLWQINSVHGAQSTFDPMGNARAAVALSSNGSNWKPWCTAYTDGACGTKGGSYAPTGNSPSGKRLSGNGGGTIPPDPGTGGSVVPASSGPLSEEFWNSMADNAVGGLLKAANHLLFFSAVIFGGVSFFIGVVMLFRETSTATGIASDVSDARSAYRNVGARAKSALSGL
jgi:hypothetical protein